MASVWSEARGEAPKKLIGRVPTEAAVKVLKGLANDWKQQGDAYSYKPVAGMTILLMIDSTVVGSLFIEPISPPSKPDPGETYRTQQAA